MIAVRILLVLLCLYTAAARAEPLSEEDSQLYAAAFDLLHKRQFEPALAAARAAHDPLLAKVLAWDYYVTAKSGADFADITAFIRANPDWPLPAALKRRAEEAITPATPQAAILDWFAQHPPVGVEGVTAYAQALPDQARAADLVRKFWISGSFKPEQIADFLGKFGPMIRPEDDAARLDRLLWEHQDAAARQQLARVDTARRLAGEARLAFASDSSNAEALAAQLPEEPGLIYERIRYLRNHDRDADAIELLRRAPRDQTHPDLWWTERAVLIQHALQKGDASAAYDLAQSGERPTAAIYADAEWLSGWIALRSLGDATQALDHFSRLYDHVAQPRSRSRAAFWAGRAAEALGKGDEAVRWFGLAAQNVTTFYGQLAGARLHQDKPAELPPDPAPLETDISRFEAGAMPELARLLTQIREGDLARFFLVRGWELAKTPGEKVLAADLAVGLGQPDIAVTIAQQTEREGLPLFEAGYPVFPTASDQPEPALLLSLIRKESLFHANLVSGAGARGLMQLMPATAAELARSLKIGSADKDKLTAQLTQDPALNLQLGSAYVGTLLKDFDGSYLLAVTAYNAGPNRVKRWLADMGDPRAPGADPVDWIERIPYWETRDYVQRVLETMQIYRRKLGAPPKADF